MSIELRVARGARAGHRQPFDTARILLGRDAGADLRLDPERDLDVSTRHAEIVRGDTGWRIRDLGSTNGTFVNDERIAGERALRDGDVISLGRDGPRIDVSIGGKATAPPRVPRRGTMERIEVAVRARTNQLRLTLAALVAVLVIGVTAAFWVGRRGVAERDDRLIALLARHDSLGARFEREMDALSTRLSGLDGALSEARRESEVLRAELERERMRGSTAELELLARRLGESESRQTSIATAARMDHGAIASASGPAVVLIAVEMPDGSRHTGTGFSVTRDGAIVTNRHVVRDSTGALPVRLAVIFAGTQRWIPARVVRVSEATELAVIALESGGRHPVIAGLAPSAQAIAVGAPVTVIGYPLGMETPMSPRGVPFTAHASLGVGTVSKVLPDVVQIDAWAGQGSSGSPVFDADGRVAAVIFGGARESAGRLVYAVPVAEVRALLAAAGITLDR